MAIDSMIVKLRTGTSMSQEQFAELFGVSRQSVQKWENGTSIPELDKLIKISKYFSVSLDSLILNFDARLSDELKFDKILKPKFDNMLFYLSYPSNLDSEYKQSIDEGLDIEQYADVFSAVSRLPLNEAKKKLADVLFDIVINAKTKEDYKYIEPSTLQEIKNLRKDIPALPDFDKNSLRSKILGAWMGRICGCLLGATIEGMKTDELVPFLKESNNYPMHRYILRSDVTDAVSEKYKYPLTCRFFADNIEYFPGDDDTNYMILAQEVIERYGKDFTPFDMSRAWLASQNIEAYCTAERVAYSNFVKGFMPPESAVYKNPYREWIGAQIRGDYFGYINPGNPELAADMAFRDASISHIKNGIYGEMFVSAMIAVAACTNNIEEIILGGLAQIPYTSRLYEAVTDVLNGYKNGISKEDCFADIHKRFDEYSDHGWVHTISNAMIVTAALLYGEGDYGKSICMSVETGYDTDCNAATIGSILGMANGIESIDEYWTKPINDTMRTTVYSIGLLKISDRVDLTLKHIDK